MLKNLHAINFLRWVVFLFSVLGFGCHLGQYLLLTTYQEKASIPNWVQAGHWQYLTWWVVLGLSLASSSAIILHAFCFKRAELMRGDKILAIFNILPLVTSILTAVLFVTNEPWTNGIVDIKRPFVTDLITYCHQLDSPTIDQYHPLLYHRCLLSDATWIGVALICLFWICLLIIAFCTEPLPDKSVIVNQVKEPHWGRYMPDPVDQQHHPPHRHPSTHGKKIQTSSLPQPLVPYSYQKHQNHHQQQYLDHSSYYYQQQGPPQSEKVELYDHEDDTFTYYSTNTRSTTPRYQ